MPASISEYVRYLKNEKKKKKKKNAVEAATRGAPCKNVFLEISQNSQENTCARVSLLIKLQAEPFNFIKEETVLGVFM